MSQPTQIGRTLNVWKYWSITGDMGDLAEWAHLTGHDYVLFESNDRRLFHVKIEDAWGLKRFSLVEVGEDEAGFTCRVQKMRYFSKRERKQGKAEMI